MQARPLSWHLGNLALALALPGLGWADYQFGSEVRLTAFFLIPIILLTWRLGAFAGYLSGIAAFIVLVTVRMSQFSDDGDHLLLTADLLGRFLAFFLIVVICSRLHAAYRLQRHIATHDGLSGLLSRSGLLLQLDARRPQAAPSAMLFIDCDHFKAMNDSQGHRAGDQLLQTVADQLQSLPWEGKLACRLGGDEFVVYLPACGERDARELVGQLQHALRQAMHTQSWPVTYSIGVALYPDGPLAAERMFSYTDTLMYQAKQAGGDRARFGHYPVGAHLPHGRAAAHRMGGAA